MYQANELIIFRRESEGNSLLFNPENGKLFGLNPVATLIWEALVNGNGRCEILQSLEAQTVTLPDQAETDIDEFITSLQEHGFLAFPA